MTSGSRSRAVIVRLRGRSELGVTFIDVLARCAASLEAVGSRLLLVSTNERIGEQLAATRIAEALGAGSVYPGGERVGAALERAWADADAWVASRPAAGLPG